MTDRCILGNNYNDYDAMNEKNISAYLFQMNKDENHCVVLLLLSGNALKY